MYFVVERKRLETLYSCRIKPYKCRVVALSPICLCRIEFNITVLDISMDAASRARCLDYTPTAPPSGVAITHFNARIAAR